MKNTRTLVLASASPRRRDLLSEHGYHYEVHPAAVTEIAPPHLTAGEMVRFNALLKAREVSRRFPESLVLGVDTLVSLDGQPIGKPVDREEAFIMLSRLSGRVHQVYSGVALICRATGEWQVAVEVSHVRFRELSPDEIRCYMARIDPMDKAGAYAAQDEGEGSVVAEIEGSRSNVIGLPMELLAKMV